MICFIMFVAVVNVGEIIVISTSNALLTLQLFWLG